MKLTSVITSVFWLFRHDEKHAVEHAANFERHALDLGSPLIDGIFLVQKMCICSCVTLSTTLLMRAVQFKARSACDASRLHYDVNVDASQADRALNWTARITKIYHQLVGYLCSGPTKYLSSASCFR